MMYSVKLRPSQEVKKVSSKVPLGYACAHHHGTRGRESGERRIGNCTITLIPRGSLTPNQQEFGTISHPFWGVQFL